MKKLGLATLVIGLALWSLPALADVAPPVYTSFDNNAFDGQNIIDGAQILIDTEGYAATQAPRTFDPGEAWGPQSISMSIPVSASIPCYLEFLFQGNDTNRLMTSWGPDGEGGGPINTNANGNYIAFHPEVGGYIDADWNVITGPNGNGAILASHDKNFEASIEGRSYIRACDTFISTLWSNMPYKYSVSFANGGLTGGFDNKTLPVEMRFQVGDETLTFAVADAKDNSAWTSHVFDAAPYEVIPRAEALTTSVVVQQFRVPFNRQYTAGRYTGTATFTAATIAPNS